MNPEHINSLVTLVVGLAAFVVYWLSKRHEKRSAAAIVVMDIRHAEQVVHSLLERGVADKNMKAILYENNWAKFQHLFATDLSYDDLSAINRFFDSCVEISEARRRLNETFYVSVNAKVCATQQQIMSIDDISTTEGQQRRSKLVERCNTEAYAFEPADPKNIVLQQLNLMGRPSTSIAFSKLKRIAGFRA